MPRQLVQLVGSYNERTIDGTGELTLGKDQQFLNCTFDVVKNPLTGKTTVYVQKRPGWGVSSVVAPGNVSTGLIRTEAIGSTVSAFGASNSTIYDSTTAVGIITGRALHFMETLLASTVAYVLIRSSDGTAWYYGSDAGTNLTGYTFDGNNSTTVTDIKLNGVASVSGLYVGQKLTAGANIVAGTRIVSINSGAFSAVLDTATTGGAFNDLAVTKEAVAKITDADFVTFGRNISTFVEMDGYVFYVAEDGYLYNSNLNSITAYAASDKIAVNMSPDPPYAIARAKNLIVAFGSASTEFFYNAGNPSGSPLSRAEQFFNRIGVQNQRSVVSLENDIYFVGSTRAGDISVRVMKGSQIAPISTPAIERIMGTAAATGAEIYLSAFTMGGFSYVVANVITLTATEDLLLLESDDFFLLESGDRMVLEGAGTAGAPSLLRCFVFNVELNIWSEWDSALCTYITGAGVSSVNQVIASSRTSTSGKIYALNPAADSELHTDDGAAFTMSIRTSRIDFGTNRRKFVRSVRLLCDKQASGTATLTYSDDDYATSVTAGTFDLTSMEPRITRLGSHVGGRSYTLTHSADTAFRAEGLEFVYDYGTASVSVKDFQPYPYGAELDSEEVRAWLDKLRNRLCIDYQQVVVPAGGDELYIFDISASLTGKVTLDNVFAAITTLGNITVGNITVNGSAVINGNLTIAGWITFPATQVPSSDPNTLDDYEEGTWTPLIQSETGSGSHVYLQTNGYYTKIGRLVKIDYLVAITTKDAGMSGSYALVRSLPFAKGSYQTYDSIPMSYWTGLATAATFMTGHMQATNSFIYFFWNNAAVTGLGGILAPADITNGSTLAGSGTYHV